MKRKFLVVLLSCTMLLAFAGCGHDSATNQSSTSEKVDYVDFASELVKNYYLNKDLDENNNISDCVTTEVEMLLDTKIEMGQIQREALELEYRDYTISVVPVEEEAWVVSDEEISMSLQVIRTWYETDVETEVSEVVDVKLSSDASGYIVTECYERYESLTMGPIDELYREDLATSDSANASKFLEEYLRDYEQQCLEKK